MDLFQKLYSFQFVALLACAVFFFRAGEFESRVGNAARSLGFLWASLSVLLYVITWIVLSWGMIACIACQVALFFGISIVRVLLSIRNS